MSLSRVDGENTSTASASGSVMFFDADAVLVDDQQVRLRRGSAPVLLLGGAVRPCIVGAA
jgi:hypothetical protein